MLSEGALSSLTEVAPWALPLLAPFIALLDPSRRIFLPYLGVALLLALIVAARELQRRGLRISGRRLLRVVFPARYLRGSSVRLDLWLWLFNSIWRAAVLPSAQIMFAGVAAVIAVGLRLVQPAPPTRLDPWLVSAFFTITLFVVSDLSRYVLHRWMHRVPALWRLHQVHHLAYRLTPLTLHRVHPIESLLFTLRGALAVGTVTGVFVYLFPEDLSAWTVLGVNVFGASFNLIGANLRHSHVWFSFGPKLERWILSPAQHQVHHSRAREHFDTNLGSFLAIWDRMFGTLLVPAGRLRMRFGLAANERNHDDGFLSALLGPLLRRTKAD